MPLPASLDQRQVSLICWKGDQQILLPDRKLALKGAQGSCGLIHIAGTKSHRINGFVSSFAQPICFP